VRSGIDPYTFFLESNGNPRLADGLEPPLSPTPANSPSLVLLLTPFSYLNWTAAKFLWMLVNIAILALLPFVLLAIAGGRLPARYSLLFIAGSYSLLATRVLIGNGQTTAVIFILMLGTFWLARKGSRVASGITLGIATAKISLALPVFLWLLWTRRYRIAAIALAVQMTFFGALFIITGTSPIRSISSYISILSLHVSNPGIHLSPFVFSNGGLFLSIMLAVILLIPVLIAFRQARRHINPYYDFILLGILFVWSLLAGYHGVYDGVLALPLILGLLILSTSPNSVETRAVRAVRVIVLSTLLLSSLPGEAVGRLLQFEWWDYAVRAGITTSLIAIALGGLLLPDRRYAFSREGSPGTAP